MTSAPGNFRSSHAPSVIEAREIVREFDGGAVRALRGVSLAIAEGEFVAITGQSGSGKTTLMHMMGALDRPDSGAMLYKGQSIAELRDPSRYRSHEVGYIFQAFFLLPTFTAVENVQIPMFESSLSVARRRERAVDLLKSVGMGHRLDHFPGKLSGGERQRVAIARSLANSPAVLLADEPTGNLDSENAALILDLLRTVHREKNVTLVMVTHDPGIASMADRVIAMKDGHIASDPAAGGIER